MKTITYFDNSNGRKVLGQCHAQDEDSLTLVDDEFEKNLGYRPETNKFVSCIRMEYMSPCVCDKCLKGKHCNYCLNGNPGSHRIWTPEKELVLTWFWTCFPQYRKKEKICFP